MKNDIKCKMFSHTFIQVTIKLKCPKIYLKLKETYKALQILKKPESLKTPRKLKIQFIKIYKNDY